MKSAWSFPLFVALGELVVLACSDCVPRPRAAPRHPYKCRVPTEVAAAAQYCPGDAFVDVEVVSEETMERFRGAYYPSSPTSPRALTWFHGPGHYVVLIREDMTHKAAALMEHEVRCHVQSVEDGLGTNMDHEPRGGLPCGKK